MARKRGSLAREEREQQILREAARIFATKGYHAASVTEIVESSGVARGTFYNYFDSKEDVFLKLVNSYFEQLTDILERNSARLREAVLGGGRPLEAWLQNALDYLRFHRDNPHLTSIIYRLAMGRDNAFSQKVENQAVFARKKMAESLDMLLERGMIIPCDTELAATFIAGSSVGLILSRLLWDEDRDLTRLAFELVRNQSRAMATSQMGIDRFLKAMERELFAAGTGAKESAGEG
ncbi:MAG: TetR/AcrR family transcriptional regulator [Actinobacteria bacterium]|nr:TetR/AcrR family transcriptional regulator [Actinomycetota bacterium]